MMSVYLVVLGVMMLFLLLHIVKGPTIWDRMLGLNLFSVLIVLAIVLYAVFSNQTMYLDIAITFGLLGFVGTQFIAVFVRKRGNI